MFKVLLCTAILASVSAFGVGLLADDQPPASQLDGSWEIVGLTRGDLANQVLPEEDTSGTVEIRDGTIRYAIRSLGMVREAWTAKFTVEESDGAIDLLFTSGPERDSRMAGLFEVYGDEVRICLPIREPFLERPTVVNAEHGSNRELLVLRRKK